MVQATLAERDKDVVQAIEFLGDPRGRRYTAVDRETAYVCWRTNRSIRRTAETLGLSPSTVGSWSQSDAWVRRAKGEDAEDVADMRRAVSAIAVGEVVKSIEVAREIRDNAAAAARDRLAAAQWIAGLAGVAAIAKVETSVIDQAAAIESQRHTISQESLVGLSPDELMRIEQEIRAGTRSGAK